MRMSHQSFHCPQASLVKHARFRGARPNRTTHEANAQTREAVAAGEPGFLGEALNDPGERQSIQASSTRDDVLIDGGERRRVRIAKALPQQLLVPVLPKTHGAMSRRARRDSGRRSPAGHLQHQSLVSAAQRAARQIVSLRGAEAGREGEAEQGRITELSWRGCGQPLNPLEQFTFWSRLQQGP